VPHVGEQRLGPGHCQHNGAEGHEGLPDMACKQGDGVDRVERPQNAWLVEDLPYPKHGQRGKPDAHYGAEQLADAPGPATLH
jgi:hypothetical protein